MTTEARTVDRKLPHDLTAEKALLGALCIDSDYVDAAAAIVAPRDFFEKRHETIFSAILALSEANETVDIVTLTNRLVETGQLEAVGGRAYLVELQEDIYSAANCERYAEIIQEKSLLRKLMRTSAEIYQRSQSSSDPKDILEYADRRLFEITAGFRDSDIRTQSEIAKSLIASIDETIEAREQPEISQRWLRTGITELDNMLFRLDPGLMTIVAARPGDGKTALALEICDWLDRCGVASAFVSEEMPEEQLLLRLVSSKTEVPMWKIRTGELDDRELARVYAALGEYGSGACKLHITHPRGNRTPFEVRRRLRKLQREYSIKLGVVDYVQQLNAPGRKWDKRTDELSFISNFLCETADELGIHLIVCSQMSRPEKGKPEREPLLEDLRDCLVGSSLILNAETGQRIELKEVFEKNLRFPVWSMNDNLKLQQDKITDVWEAGFKRIIRIRTQTGRIIKSSEGHQLFSGRLRWEPVSQLREGDHIACPRKFPHGRTTSQTPWNCDRTVLLGLLIGNGYLSGTATLTVPTAEDAEFARALGESEFGLRPTVKREHASETAMRVTFTTGSLTGAKKNPLTRWLRELGVWSKRAPDKHAPDDLFGQSQAIWSAFLRGLFHADGSIVNFRSRRYMIKLATTSERLARDVQHLLARCGIISSIRYDRFRPSARVLQGKGLWTVIIGSITEVNKFVEHIGFLNQKQTKAEAILRKKQNDSAHLDRLPPIANRILTDARRTAGLSHGQLGYRDQGKLMSRETARAVAQKLKNRQLALLADSDLIWDKIVEISELPEEMTYDLTVSGAHNYCADDVLHHNCGSLEQDANNVLFIHHAYRYQRDKNQYPEGYPDLILRKQRQGATGTVRVYFDKERVRFTSTSLIQEMPL